MRLRAALAAFRTTTFTARATLTARFAIPSAFAGLIVAAAARLFGIGFAIAGAVARLARRLSGFAFDRLGDRYGGFDLGDRLADQFFDRQHGLLVGRAHQRDRGAGAAGAAGTADAVHVVVGMMRDVEIIDVADGGNIETAGGDVGSHQDRQLALAELVQRGRAGRLLHVAMQGADTEAVLLERLGEQRDFTLAVAEDDRILEVGGFAEKGPEHFALLVRLATDGHLRLGHGDGGGGGLGDFDLHRIMQEGLGDAADFGGHGRRKKESPDG